MTIFFLMCIKQLQHWPLCKRFLNRSIDFFFFSPLFSLPQPVFWKAVLGEHNLKLTEGNEKTSKISHVLYNPWYRGYDNDIAVMRLAEPVQFNKYISPICMPDDDLEVENMLCTATGWGKIDFGKI